MKDIKKQAEKDVLINFDENESKILGYVFKWIDRAYSAGADEFIKSLGDPVENNIYLIKPYNGEWWLEHKIVGSGEPLRQALNPQSNEDSKKQK